MPATRERRFGGQHSTSAGPRLVEQSGNPWHPAYLFLKAQAVVAAEVLAKLRGGVCDLSGSNSELPTRVTDIGTVIDLPSDALFEYYGAVLTTAAEDQLRKAAELTRAAPAGEVAIIGHTDSHGDEVYNQRLSKARARAVAAWFMQQPGVRQRPFAISGKGETDPIAPNATPAGADDPSGRAKNRGVVVVIPDPAE